MSGVMGTTHHVPTGYCFGSMGMWEHAPLKCSAQNSQTQRKYISHRNLDACFFFMVLLIFYQLSKYDYLDQLYLTFCFLPSISSHNFVEFENFKKCIYTVLKQKSA